MKAAAEPLARALGDRSAFRDTGPELPPVGTAQVSPPPADPWQHRSNGMRCSSCMWYVPKIRSNPAPEEYPQVGRCRRHAPTMSGFPVVFAKDWCGDHKLDENKVGP